MIVTGIDMSGLRDGPAVRALLGMAGCAGPWAAGGPLSLRFIEQDGCTAVTTAPALPPLSDLARPEPIAETTSTVLVHRNVAGGLRLIFPLRGIERFSLGGESLAGAIEVLSTRSPSRPLAVAGRHGDHPVLLAGFSLSDFADQSRRGHWFFGFGHVVFVLKWFIETFAGLALVGVSPWPGGRPPLVLSFDVEGKVARRSTGKTVLCIPLAGWNLLELSRLRMHRPIVSKRSGRSTNVLKDPDGQWTSHRWVRDRRPGPEGNFADDFQVDQWQLSPLIRKRPAVGPGGYAAFTKWAGAAVGRCTCFYCGLAAAPSGGGAEAAFHSFEHRHFNQMAPAALRAELARAAASFFPAGAPRAVRAPGLLWSDDYFRALGELGFHADASFKEVNAFQPIFPVRAGEGWWEVPVTGPVFGLPAGPGAARAAAATGGMISVYAHDFELSGEAERADYAARVAALQGAGFAPTGVLELVEWLARAEGNQIEELREAPDGSVAVSARLARGSALVLRPPLDVGPGTDRDTWVVQRDGEGRRLVYASDEPRARAVLRK
jgi:peptidoglycan/xylan/chitin deacetylase (PgdA/CDA1 family)